MGEAYFQWNMQFTDSVPQIEGDLEIKPRGTAAVMQKEVRSQRLTTLLQTASNPTLAPFIKIPNLMRELAIAQDIDPDSLVNDVSEAQIFAEILKGLVNAQQEASQQPQSPDQQRAGMEQSGGVPAGANPNDDSGVGGGTIGTGSVPTAGETGFTGTDQETQERPPIGS